MRAIDINRKRLISVNSEKTFNTLIGGKAASITTAAQLETWLNLSSGDVEDFTIEENDIKCNISISYTVNQSTFNSDLEITHFKDLSGNISADNNNIYFRSCANLTEVIISLNGLNNTVVGTSSLRSLSNLTLFKNASGGDAFSNILSMPDYYLMDSTLLGQSGFNYSKFLSYGVSSCFNSGLDGILINHNLIATGVSSNTIFKNTQLTGFHSNTVTSFGIRCFENTPMSDVNLDIECPLVTEVGESAYQNCDNISSFIGNSVTSLAKRSFFYCSDINYIEFKNPSLIMGANVFQNTGTSGTRVAHFHINLQTSNGGNEDANVAYLRGRGWTITYNN